ncbi:ribosome modulation factor [Xanthomonas arboricola]|uniref:ribosome modulation factor n=1 Tax=Xanthomonas cannabis TaxID=1885674 RepID=UPI00161177BA|nr:Rmf/CrpP family protein [Xanthomonas cannabis]MBB3802038.1 ribosome modulation factor [Xanthomonas cannabis]
MTRAQQLTQARESGRYAREAGRPLSSCPLYGITDEDDELRKAWQRGYQEGRKAA